MSKAAADRLAAWRPLGFLTDLVHVVADTRLLVDENRTILNRLEGLMADVSQLLNEVADGLRGPLATSINDLIASEAAARAEAAQLRGEDVAESDAAANVKAAFDEVASKFSASPDVPDVAPLPPVDETPAPPGDEGEPSPAA